MKYVAASQNRFDGRDNKHKVKWHCDNMRTVDTTQGNRDDFLMC